MVQAALGANGISVLLLADVIQVTDSVRHAVEKRYLRLRDKDEPRFSPGWR